MTDGRAEQRAREVLDWTWADRSLRRAPVRQLARDVLAQHEALNVAKTDAREAWRVEAEAVALIDSLREELASAERVAATLRQALEEIAGCDFDGAAPRMRRIARAALAAAGETETGPA